MRIDRRRHRRVSLQAEELVRMELRHRVRLLDISLSGALIACTEPVPVGARSRLRVGLGGDAFTTDLHIARQQPAPRKNVASGLGAMFASMDESSRRLLEQFLRRASE